MQTQPNIGLSTVTTMKDLGEGLKKLKGMATPKKDQHCQLILKFGSYQRLSYQPQSIQGWSEATGTYIAQGLPVWPQWEMTQ